MFKFLAKGLLRDRSRSLFPIMIVSAGVMLTVILYCWLNGFKTMMIYDNARFDTGHVKIVTQAYSEIISHKPFDLGILGLDKIIPELEQGHPEMTWLPRIYFGGLLDIPDEKGETEKQGEVYGMGVDLLSSDTEKTLLNLDKALITGRLPLKSGEILISDEIAEKLNTELDDKVTIISSTMYGSMAMNNFTVVGTVRFGIQALDRGAVIMDISDSQYLLDMENAAGEIVGYLPDFEYNETVTYAISERFNQKYSDKEDEFSPVMLPLREQNNLDMLLNLMNERLSLMIFIFIFIMSLVLWNSGLMNGIRRYGEVGVRLAIGEPKGHIYRTMILESALIGFVGSVIGTALGLTVSYIMQYKGIEFGSLMKDVAIIMSSTMRAQVDTTSYLIGFIPGFFATIIGSMLSGIGIYKRKTAQLFKELEA